MENYDANLHAVIDNSDAPIFAINKNWEYIFFNASHKNVVKRSRGVNIKVGDNYLQIISGNGGIDREKAIATFERVMAGERFQVIETYGDPDKYRAPYEITYNPILGDSGEILGASIFSQDITERIYIQNELLQQKLKIEEQACYLEELNEFKNRLLSIIAHDLRSPISNLILSIQWVESGVITNEEIPALLSGIGKGAQTIKRTLDDLLHWSLIESHFNQAQPEDILMQPFIDEHINMYTALAKRKNIKITSNCPDDIYLNADKIQLSLIFRNFIDNAIKFTPMDGHIDIGIKVGDRVHEIYCANSGKGMNKNTIDKILLSKNGHTSYGTSGEKGTGLGLQLCKEFISNMNSELKIQSFPDEHTVFYFTLPVAYNKIELQ